MMFPEQYWLMTCVVLIPATLYASWIDHKERRVPNWLNVAIALVGFGFQGAINGSAGLWAGVLGMLVGFGVLIVPWLMHGMGAGDVKLMSAIGVWFGPMMTLVSFALGACIGGVIATVMILRAGKFWMAYANAQTIMAKVSNKDTVFSEFGSAKSFGDSSALLPYGVPLTIGSIIVLIGQTFGWWMI